MKKLVFVIVFVLLAVGGFYILSKGYNKAKEGYDDTHEQQKEQQQPDKKAAVNLNAADDADISDQKDGASDYNPAIWKIEHNGKTSYLFGSIHVGDKSMYPLPEKVMQAFSDSDTLAVEADISKVDQMEMAQMVQQMALDMENPLPTVLSEKTKAKYDIYCEKQASTCQMVKIFEPWMAAITIEAMNIMQLGYSEDLGIDKFFLRSAENKEVVELESIKSQLTMLDQMPKDLQDYMVFGAVIKDEEDFTKLMTAWRTGQLDDLMEKTEAETLALGIPEDVMNQFNDIFLYKRNQVMADGIADLINQGKSVFAVVGAAHYAGKNSVNQYLEEKGFKIERM